MPRLIALRPDVYDFWTVETFGAAMRAAGVATVSLHPKIESKGVTRKGVRLDALEIATAAGGVALPRYPE